MLPRGRAIQLLGRPSLSTIRLCIEVDAGGGFWRSGCSGADRQRHAPAFPSAVGCGDLRTPFRLGDSYPEGQYLLDCYRVRVAGGNSVVCIAGTDDEAASLSNFQSAALIAAYADGFGWRYCRGGGGW